jgi:flavin reductase (DIM6/NTAB) family NADH-FMN oxidoreductase RutF
LINSSLVSAVKATSHRGSCSLDSLVPALRACRAEEAIAVEEVLVLTRRPDVDARTLDPRALRSALGHFATGVAVVTAQAGDRVLAITINSFSSVSLSPPLVLFSVADTSPSLPPLLAADRFAISVLNAGQTDLSGRFAGPRGAKWEGIEPALRPGGCPAVGPCHAVFECQHYADYDGGDHRIVVARIVAFETDPDSAPLIFHRGGYHELNASQD